MTQYDVFATYVEILADKATFSQRAVSRAAPKVDNMHFVLSVHTARLTTR